MAATNNVYDDVYDEWHVNDNIRLNFVPGLANIKVRSKLGFLAATSNARHAPTDSPTKYIGLFGNR